MATVLEAPSAESVRGVVTLTASQLRSQRRVTLFLTVFPPLALAVAIASLWGRGIHPRDAWILGSFFAFTLLGITLGFHRLFTHRSFRAVAPVRIALAIAGSMAVEGSVISWVATHRRHHLYADRFGDPHSPHLAQAPGVRGVVRGLWHAHMGWLFDAKRTNNDEYAPDLVADAAISRIDRSFGRLVLVTFLAPALIGFALTRTFEGALWAFVWGSLVRVLLLHHFTWSINSICHFYGKEQYRARDESKNVWPLSLFSFGESWHNNHHAFPWSARLGLRAWQIDIGWYVLKFLRAVRLVSHVRVPGRAQMEAKLISRRLYNVNTASASPRRER